MTFQVTIDTMIKRGLILGLLLILVMVYQTVAVWGLLRIKSLIIELTLNFSDIIYFNIEYEMVVA